jgi:hypothetical protein
MKNCWVRLFLRPTPIRKSLSTILSRFAITSTVCELVTEPTETLHGISGDIFGYPPLGVIDEASCSGIKLKSLLGPDVP